MCKGETTNERFGKNSYQKQHQIFQENLEIDPASNDPDAAQNSYNINAIDDMTSKNGSLCGNLLGMCCNLRVMHQTEILIKTKEAYGTEHTLGWERHTTHVNTQASVLSYDDLCDEQNKKKSNQEPLLSRD